MWSMQGMTDKTSEEFYSIDSITIYLNKKYLGTLEYYLSDSINQVFDSSKVGKIMKGKYIVSMVLKPPKRSTDLRPVSVYEIIELTQNKLIIRNKNQDLLEFVPNK
jgi:hypothetical protein